MVTKTQDTNKRVIEYSIGVDPGWKNLGWAILKSDSVSIELIKSGVFSPASYPSIKSAVREINGTFNEIITEDVSMIHANSVDRFDYRLTLERYVSYADVNSGETENILMTIGGIIGSTNIDKISLVRAIDWKMNLVKFLAKNRSFENPSSSLDKKFSIAAAKECLSTSKNKEFTTDHEADAICLGALPLINAQFAVPKKA